MILQRNDKKHTASFNSEDRKKSCCQQCVDDTVNNQKGSVAKEMAKITLGDHG